MKKTIKKTKTTKTATKSFIPQRKSYSNANGKDTNMILKVVDNVDSVELHITRTTTKGENVEYLRGVFGVNLTSLIADTSKMSDEDLQGLITCNYNAMLDTYLMTFLQKLVEDTENDNIDVNAILVSLLNLDTTELQQYFAKVYQKIKLINNIK